MLTRLEELDEVASDGDRSSVSVSSCAAEDVVVVRDVSSCVTFREPLPLPPPVVDLYSCSVALRDAVVEDTTEDT